MSKKKDKKSSSKNAIDNLRFSKFDRALFGTLFAMEKGEDDSGEESIIDYGPLLFEILQCVGLPMQEIMAWPMGPIKNLVMGALDYMDFQFFTTTPNMSYILFSVLFVLVMASVFIFIALLFVFKNGDSRVPLPLVQLLRIITNASVTWGYQPMITIIFMIVDCDFSSGKGMCDMYPEVPCWEGAQAVFNSISLFTLVVFVPFTQFVILFLYEFDVKHNVMLAAHSGRYEFVEMACKCILTAESQWLSSYFVLRCLSCILMFGFCMFYIMWMQPYHSLHTNVFASAQYGWTLTSSFYSWVALYTEGAGAFVIVLFWITYIAISFFSTFFVAVYARKIYLARCAITYNFKIPVIPGIPFQNMDKPFFLEVSSCKYSTYRGFVYQSVQQQLQKSQSIKSIKKSESPLQLEQIITPAISVDLSSDTSRMVNDNVINAPVDTTQGIVSPVPYGKKSPITNPSNVFKPTAFVLNMLNSQQKSERMIKSPTLEDNKLDRHDTLAKIAVSNLQSKQILAKSTINKQSSFSTEGKPDQQKDGQILIQKVFSPQQLQPRNEKQGVIQSSKILSKLQSQYQIGKQPTFSALNASQAQLNKQPTFSALNSSQTQLNRHPTFTSQNINSQNPFGSLRQGKLLNQSTNILAMSQRQRGLSTSLQRPGIQSNVPSTLQRGQSFMVQPKPVTNPTNQDQKNLRPTPPYFIPKIKKVSHIDAAVRFVWNKQVRKRKPYIDFASYIYDEGLKRFPKHPTLRTHFALFLCHYRKNWDEAMKQFTIAYSLGATIDNRWIIFYMSKIYEQANSGADLKSADVLSLFRYKNHLSSAENNSRDAKQKLKVVLTKIYKGEDEDVMHLSALLDELIDNEYSAEEHYKALLETHPFSIPVLRGYASLKTDIFR
ncbi:MAG: hypothetical protein EZS28_006675 [Streblomastix strix]|uniref:TmcB/TmcC TPR repeats domain-containing protein n=1 Tax=Streblomastix strix TaxID=222440 RepID=A0A5J4WUG2_9EUKA|nr:MAG: hypothetical protein EZS28_006675 [Streblomastix strix]